MVSRQTPNLLFRVRVLAHLLMECLLTGIAVTMFVVALALRVLVPLGLIAGVVAMIFSKRFRNWVDEK